MIILVNFLLKTIHNATQRMHSHSQSCFTIVKVVDMFVSSLHPV